MSTASVCPACGSLSPAGAPACANCGRPLSAAARPFVVPPGQGTTVRGPVGGPLTIKARAETTGGRFTLFENLVAPKEGPPLHRHGREDEMWYILEGRFRFRADGEIFLAPAGSFVFIPRGTAHCLQNIGDRPSRILVMFTPAGMERFFERHAELPPGPVDPGAYRAIAHDSAMEVVGRPLAESDPL
ncbi:MAG TPA: cupin domain-containing protein [Thermoplasmata archaeon]|nr:cupin domain-containing protein [Thermoplasmata archaeon]